MGEHASTKTAVVIVDAANPATGKCYRTSHWPDELEERGLTVQCYCVPDYVKQRKMIPLKAVRDAGILIISWDTVNGDPFCEADTTLHFFQVHGKALVAALTSQGGILFSDFQTAYGVPVQASYDGIFGAGELKVLCQVLEKDARSGREAVRFRGLRRHPLLPAEARIEAQPVDRDERRFSLSVDDRDQADTLLYEHARDSLWFGWFTSWRRDWIPLLSASLPDDINASSHLVQAPILLAKVADRGLLVASTMGVATAKCTKLMDRLVEANMSTIHNYHRRAMLRRNSGDLTWAAGTFVVLALITGGLWVLYASQAPGAISVYMKMGLSMLSVGVLTAITIAWHLYRTYVWNRPHGTRVLDPLWVRLRPHLQRR